MSSVPPFSSSASAALKLKEQWREVVRVRVQHTAAPSLLELQTICRESGISLPDLDSFARMRDLPPMFLLCGGDQALAAEIAALFGYQVEWPEFPKAPLIWSLQPGKKHHYRIRHATTEQDVTAKALHALLGKEWPSQEFLVIEESVAAKTPWSFGWIPYTEFLQSPDGKPIETEFLLRQRAALVITDTAPQAFTTTLEELNQKLWLVSADLFSGPDERERLIAEIATVQEDRFEDLALRVTAAWRWLVNRLLSQIEQKRRQYDKHLKQYENKTGQTRHLLQQYRTNWVGGVRSLVESHLQNRVGGSAFAPFFDVQKSGPQTDTFLTSLALTGLWNKLDEYLTDRMADLVGGLGGLAAKLELRRISLGDANAHWDAKALTPRLETILNEKKVFPAGGGKRGGIAANLTGRKQAVLDERRGQLAAGIRTIAQFITGEFANWSSALINTLETSIQVQLIAALLNQGLPDADGMRAAQSGLDRLEEVLRTRHETAPDPDVSLSDLLASLSRGGLIPLYHPPASPTA
ncbi:MAG: hypothetical protein ACOZB3_04570 [Calditrichota bacterium]